MEVTLIDLKRWIKDLPETQHLLVKMDIEGKEFEVLPHILPALPANTAILFETHSNFGNSDRLISQLIANGFSVNEVRSRTEVGVTFKDCMAVRLSE
jgi:hypothetical protein